MNVEGKVLADLAFGFALIHLDWLAATGCKPGDRAIAESRTAS
jgi:hypothetical protein